MTSLRALLFPAPARGAPTPRVAGSFGYTIAGVGFQGVARFAFSLMVGHIAGKALLGSVNLLVALATFLVLCWPQATATAASKYIAVARGQQDVQLQIGATNFIARLAVFGSGALALAAFVVARESLDATAVEALEAAALVLAMGAYTYVRGLRYGNSQFATGAAWDLVSSILSLILLAAVLLGHHWSLLLVPLVASYVLGAIVGWPTQPGTLPLGLRREVTRFVAWNSAQVVAAGGLLQLVLILASPFATQSELGDFAAAVSLATPAVLVSIALRTSMAPSVAGAYAAGREAQAWRSVDGIMRLMVLVFLPVFGVGILWASQILTLSYGADFQSARTLLVLLFMGVSVNSFNAAHLWLISTRAGGVRTLAMCNIAGLVTGVLTTLSISPSTGVTGAAVGYLVGSTVSSMAAARLVWTSEKMRWGGLAIRLAVGYGVVGVGAALIPADMNPLIRLGVTAAFVIGWLALGHSDITRLVHQRMAS